MQPPKMVSRVRHGQLLPPAVLTLTQRTGTSPNRRPMLAAAAVKPLHKGGGDLPAVRRQHMLDGLESAKHHPVRHPHRRRGVLITCAEHSSGRGFQRSFGAGPVAWWRGDWPQWPTCVRRVVR